MRFLWCTYLCSSIFGSWDQFFIYADRAFWSKNVVSPTQPHVRISTCMLFYPSYWRMSAPSKWQVREKSTAGSAANFGPPFVFTICSSPHLHTNYLPFFVPPRLSTPDDTLPMPDCLILRGRSAPTHLTPYPRNYSVWKHTISNHSKGTHGALIHSLLDHTPLGIAPWPSSQVLYWYMMKYPLTGRIPDVDCQHLRSHSGF